MLKKIYTDIQLYIVISVKVCDLTIHYLKNLINENIWLNYIVSGLKLIFMINNKHILL